MKPKRQIFKEAILMQKLLDIKRTMADERGELCTLEGGEIPKILSPKPYKKSKFNWSRLFNSYKVMLP